MAQSRFAGEFGTRRDRPPVAGRISWGLINAAGRMGGGGGCFIESGLRNSHVLPLT